MATKYIGNLVDMSFSMTLLDTWESVKHDATYLPSQSFTPSGAKRIIAIVAANISRAAMDLNGAPFAKTQGDACGSSSMANHFASSVLGPPLDFDDAHGDGHLDHVGEADADGRVGHVQTNELWGGHRGS